MSDQLFEDRAALDTALAEFVAAQLQSAIIERGEATLVVSGGSTPKGFFARLSQHDVEWSKTTTLAADDRWVPLSDPASNETMIRETLMVNLAAEGRLLSLVHDYPDSQTNLRRVNSALNGISAFDVVILGMGLDGHTASLFPCCDELSEGLTTDSPALMTHPKNAPHARISLSYRRLIHTRCGLVHLTGEEKRRVFQSAKEMRDPHSAPIASFLAEQSGFTLWYAP